MNASIIKDYSSEARARKFYEEKLKSINVENDILELYDSETGLYILSTVD